MNGYTHFRLKVLAIALLTALGPATWMFTVMPSAHIVVETPWHPLAAAYRTMLFLGDLKPVPWAKIKAAFVEPSPAAYGTRSAQEKLREIDDEQITGAGEAILAAIDAQDRQALYTAASRSLAFALQARLKQASASLDDPSQTVRHITVAQEIYRAVGDFIQQSDPEAYQRLGRAWLTLTSSAGASGVLGGGQASPDRDRFTNARNLISGYIGANFGAGAFTSRRTLTPLPETVAAAGQDVEIIPWLPPGTSIVDQDPLPKLVLNFEMQGIEESDLPLIAYGDMLFDSPQIFGDPARTLGIACSTCHNRSDINRSLFIPGISHQNGVVDVDGEFFNARFNDRRDDGIDIPSLRGLRFTAPYGRDGRLASLNDFVRNVIVNEFGGAEPSRFVLDALVSYMLEFDFLPNSKITGDGRLTDAASEAAHRGEEIFRKPFAQMQDRSCASCHVPSASFIDRLAHDIGSQTGTYAHSQSAAYDTPTLLGVRFTAPYFHDGSLPTLDAVVDWFNLRYALGLDDTEQADLTAYLEAVGDGDEPYEIYDDRNTPFRLAFEELTTFASTLDTLLPARDAAHAKLMIDTVATDLALDASAMANLSAKPKVYELAKILVEVGKAIDGEDWEQAQDRWQTFKSLQEEYDAAMY